MVQATPTRLLWRGLMIEYATLGWNVVGTAVVVAAAIAAGSVALAGFGLALLGSSTPRWAFVTAMVYLIWASRGQEFLRSH